MKGAPLAAALCVSLLTTACVTAERISPSTEEKWTAFVAHSNSWALAIDPRSHGRQRSVQMFEAGTISISGNNLEFNGDIGLASLVTPDGYALTAEHVVEPPSEILSIGNPPRNAPPARRLHVTIRDKLGVITEKHETVGLKLPSTNDHLVTMPTRIVKSFPECDLALVKLPTRAEQWFELRTKPLDAGETLFASGNDATPFFGVSAGAVIKIGPEDDGVRKIISSVPLAAGDSGGPLFDREGKLAAITSSIEISRWLPWPQFRHTKIISISPSQLARLINQDRALHGIAPPQ